MSIRRRGCELRPGDLIFPKPGRYLCEKGVLGMRLVRRGSRGLLVEYCGENRLLGKDSKRCWKVLIDGTVFLMWEEDLLNKERIENESY